MQWIVVTIKKKILIVGPAIRQDQPIIVSEQAWYYGLPKAMEEYKHCIYYASSNYIFIINVGQDTITLQ